MQCRATAPGRRIDLYGWCIRILTKHAVARLEAQLRAGNGAGVDGDVPRLDAPVLAKVAGVLWRGAAGRGEVERPRRPAAAPPLPADCAWKRRQKTRRTLDPKQARLGLPAARAEGCQSPRPATRGRAAGPSPVQVEKRNEDRQAER